VFVIGVEGVEHQLDLVPTERSATVTPEAAWPITTIFSASSSTATMAKGT